MGSEMCIRDRVLGAIFLIISILSGGGNKVASLFMYLGIAGIILGFLAPKAAFYFAVISTGYIDLIKRFMILDSSVRSTDLYYILGFTPVVVLAIFSSLSYKKILLNPSSPERSDMKRFIVAIFFMGILGVTALLFGAAVGGRLGSAVNSAAYASFIFTIPILFPTNRDFIKSVKFIILAFIPVCLYMFRQAFWGLSNFELDYLESGLTLEKRILLEEVPRLFSTLNSASNASTILSVFGACVIAYGVVRRRATAKFKYVVLGVLLGMMFAWASYYTLSRGGWICGITAIGAFIVLRSKFTAWASTIIGGLMVVSLAIFSGPILDSGFLSKGTQNLTETVGGSQAGAMAVRLGTFEGRLESLYLTVTEPERWTPFGIVVQGYDKEEVSQQAGGGRDGSRNFRTLFYSHDGFSDLLLKFGYVPLTIAGIFMFRILRKMFDQLKGSSRDVDRLAYRFSLSMVVGLLVGYLGNPAQLSTFPVNFYFYFFIGGVIVASRSLRNKFHEVGAMSEERIIGENVALSV